MSLSVKKILYTLLIIFLVSFRVVIAGSDMPEEEIEAVLTSLEHKTGEIQSLQTDFIQEKELRILDRKLELRGTICIEKPMTFAWHVKKPMRHSLIVRNGMIQQWDEDTNKVQKYPIDKNPVLRIVFMQMQGWITGKYVSMMDEYNIRKIAGEHLILEFEPLKINMSYGLINKIIITFMEDTRYINRIEILEKSGDRSTLVFVDTVFNKTIDSRLWEARPRV